MVTTHLIMAEGDQPAGVQTFYGFVPPGASCARLRVDRSTWRDANGGDVIEVMLKVRAWARAPRPDQQDYRTLIGFTAAGGDFYPNTPQGQAPAANAQRSLESSATVDCAKAQGWFYKVTATLLAPIRTSIHIDWS